MRRIAPLIASILMMAAASPAAAQPVTFAEVAPTIHRQCAPCHHPGGDGPFSLVSDHEVRRHGQQIAAAIKSGYMPPWKPSSDSGPFLGERRLNADEASRIQRWIASGAPEGTSRVSPPTFATGWLHGEPDLILTLPRYVLKAEGADTFRNFVVNVPGRGVRYVRAFQFRPGSRAVHHANIFIDQTAASRRLDDADPASGYEGLILNSAQFPDGHFLGWTPGQAAALGSIDMGWALPGGSDLVVQLHMQPTGKPEDVQPSIGVYFSDAPPASTPVILRLGRQNIDIAPGRAAERVTDSFTVPVAVSVLAVQPHAHFRARDVRAFVRLPDRTERTLIHIPDWDFRWQDQYRFAQPLSLPAGSTLELEYTFDNSAANPRNPDRPPRRVEWGWRSIDEMGDVWIQMQARTADDRAQLAALTQRKMAVEQAIGSEVLVARNPDYVTLRNDAAVTYLDLNKPDDALRHFAAVTRLTPESAVAWYNEGVALDAAGRRTEAATRYQRAIALDPAYGPAHNNLGNVLAAEHRTADAIVSYRSALAADPANAEAHCSLAQALLMSGVPTDAVAAFNRALELRPDWAACATTYVWLLSAHRDPAVRDATRAIALGEHVAALTGARDAAVLDALAAAYAAGGRFDDAVRVGQTALRLAETNAAASAAAIRERLALYQRREQFIVPD